MVAQRGGTTSATAANATSLTANKPSGVIAGDVMVAVFTNNNQTVTRPSGWTQLYNMVASTGNSFSQSLCYKVAGGSEPANYTFSVPSAAPLVLVITAWSGVDNVSPINGQYETNNPGGASEPVTGPFIDTTTVNGHMLYFRAVRFPGSTIPSFTTATSGVAEIADIGAFSGGSVCYAQCVHHLTADFTSSGHFNGLATTCNQTETDNLLSIVALKSNTPPTTGVLGATLPVAVATAFDGSLSDNATVTTTLPHPLVSAWTGVGQPVAGTGSFACTLKPVSAAVAGASAASGVMAVTVLPRVRFDGETRAFGVRVISVPRDDSRRIVVRSRGLDD
jgi:hypothetical protein